MNLQALLVLAILVSITAPVMGQARENLRPGNSTTTSGNASGGRNIPADQTPADARSATPDCGIAAETDAQRNGKTPCNPSTAVPGGARPK